MFDNQYVIVACENFVNESVGKTPIFKNYETHTWSDIKISLFDRAAYAYFNCLKCDILVEKEFNFNPDNGCCLYESEWVSLEEGYGITIPACNEIKMKRALE